VSPSSQQAPFHAFLFVVLNGISETQNFLVVRAAHSKQVLKRSGDSAGSAGLSVFEVSIAGSSGTAFSFGTSSVLDSGTTG